MIDIKVQAAAATGGTGAPKVVETATKIANNGTEVNMEEVTEKKLGTDLEETGVTKVAKSKKLEGSAATGADAATTTTTIKPVEEEAKKVVEEGEEDL